MAGQLNRKYEIKTEDKLPRAITRSGSFVVDKLWGTTVLDVNQVASVDITIDGADEPVESLLHINTRIPGVVENGLFIDLVSELLIAEDGELRVIKRKVKG